MSSNPPATSLPSSEPSVPASTGQLCVSILSACDLPSRDQPSAVMVTASGISVVSGSPTSRHRDRNSFKFGDNEGDKVSITTPLPNLYKSSMKVQVMFQKRPDMTLEAEYALNQLLVHNETTVVLNLANASTSTPPASGGGDMEVPPTLRVKLVLKGPYRTEVAALISVGKMWFGAMDAMEDSLQVAYSKLPKLPSISKTMLIIPGVPMATLLVVCSPVVAGLLVIFLPVFLPVLVALIIIASALFGTGLVMYTGTSSGRLQFNERFGSVFKSLVETKSGQTLVYNTGPRPTPVSVARVLLPKAIWGRLIASLLVDLVGSSSYLLPVVGEVFDIAWAPMQTILIMAMYDETSPNLKYVSFVEELLPFTDIVPSATIGWCMQFGPGLLGLKEEEVNMEATAALIKSAVTEGMMMANSTSAALKAR